MIDVVWEEFFYIGLEKVVDLTVEVVIFVLDKYLQVDFSMESVD